MRNFYFGTLRKYIITFGTIFSDIVIQRMNDAGDVVQAMQVPLSYAPKDKMLLRIKQDPLLDQETAITLPRMSFAHENARYDGKRKLNTIGRLVKKDDTNVNKFRAQYNPVPYNIDFSLYVYVKNAEDGTKIIEQILPYFTPEWAAQVQIIPEFDLSVDINIILKSVSSEDLFEGAFKDRRTIIWTLNFELQGYIYGPIKSSPIIKFANTRFFIGNLISNTITSNLTSNSSVTSNTIDANGFNLDFGDQVQVYPGLDANGNPTTVPVGLVETATIVSGGTGYTVDDTLTVVGGTGTSANLSVLEVSSGVITAISVKNNSKYSVNPTNPVSVTGGTGSSATFTLEISSTISALLVDIDDDWGFVIEKSGIIISFT